VGDEKNLLENQSYKLIERSLWERRRLNFYNFLLRQIVSHAKDWWSGISR